MSDTPPTSTAVPPYKLKVGYNLPFNYNSCGFDLGPNPYAMSAQDPAWITTLGRNLKTLQGAGVEVVRWFLLANGFNYGFRPNYFGSGMEHWDFDPPDPPDPRFAKHFETALQIFKTANQSSDVKIQLIPSLISFEFFGDGSRASFGPVKAQPDQYDFAPGGRSDIANHSGKRDTFLNTLLEPMLKISEQYRDVIYAWEVMNEPNWVTSSGSPGYGGHVTESTLTAFLQAAVDKINSHGIPSTVGHRYYKDLQKYPTGTKKQFHYYPKFYNSDPDPLPTAPGAFMGEVGSEHPGQYSHGTFDVDPSGPWPLCAGLDKDPDQIVQRRLQLLEALKYELGLIWPDLNVNDDIFKNNALRLSSNKLSQIRKFTSGYRTP